MTRGSRYCAVDLHVHTPASKCFRGKVTADEYVRQAIDVGLAAIAVTDHNTGDWIDRIKEAAEGTPLTVFPGVEISVAPGVHIVAIFPEIWSSDDVNEFLVTLGIRSRMRGEQDALVTEHGPQKVVSMIRSEGGLPVLAHIDDFKGAWQELSGQTREQLWQAAEFAAVEIVGDELPQEIGRDPYTHVPAYYWSSDNPHPENHTKHSHLGIGKRCSLFKLDELVTWEGLRLCFHDPAVRIQPKKIEAPIEIDYRSHPIIERVCIEGGFLDGLELTFNASLNCIIGGRGTGKSTLLELIRYAFDISAKTSTNATQAESIIANTFPAGSQILVKFWADGARYRVERIAERPPRVYRDDDGKPLDVSPHQLLPLQVYGQKEIYEISQDPKFQLRLLDNYVAEEIRPLQDAEAKLVRELRNNADDILRKKSEIEQAEERLERLGAMREELRRMQEEDFVARLKNKSNFDHEKRLLERAESDVDNMIAALEVTRKENRLDPKAFQEDVTEDLPNQPLLQQHKRLVERINKALDNTFTKLADEIGVIWSEGDEGRSTWKEAYVKQDNIYQSLLREFQAEGGRLDAHRYVELQERIAELEELEIETTRASEAIHALSDARRDLLERLRINHRQQYEIRCQKADDLTEALNRTVRITIHPEGNRNSYKTYLQELFQGLNVWRTVHEQLVMVEADEPEQKAQRPIEIRGETRYLVPKIPRYLDPVDLADAIRREQTQDALEESVLKTRWGISSSAMRNNLASLSEEKLFELEVFAVPDLPVIELRVGSGDLGYRPLSGLSVGQKCTALLAIVLLESPATLLVDQPEDDLDNQFIFDQIVETLRKHKERRQFIIATHNANIPVSGDAELIIVVQAEEERGWVDENAIGSIDAGPIKQAVAQILEGGERAFQIRREKYGIT